MKRIEICGGIAAGKTTLANLLEVNDIGHVIYEDFRSNPFWKSFYENPGEYIFETELTFTLQHYHDIKKKNKEQLVVCDYSLILDLAYANIGLTGRRLHIYQDMLKELYDEIAPADLYIYLECSGSEELKRIKNRKRDVESNIELGFLELLNNELIKDIHSSKELNILTINSENYDFVNNSQHKEIVLSRIREAMH